MNGGSGRDRNRGGSGDDGVCDDDDRDDQDEASEIEGLITAIDLSTSTVTINTEDGDTVQVTVLPNTKIERNDQHVTLAAFQVGDWGEAKFDLQGNLFKIEAETEDGEDDDDDGQTEIEGTISAINLATSTVTIRTRSGNLVDVTATAATRIERNDQHVTLAAFQVGDEIEAKFNNDGVVIELEAESV